MHQTKENLKECLFLKFIVLLCSKSNWQLLKIKVLFMAVHNEVKLLHYCLICKIKIYSDKFRKDNTELNIIKSKICKSKVTN